MAYRGHDPGAPGPLPDGCANERTRGRALPRGHGSLTDWQRGRRLPARHDADKTVDKANDKLVDAQTDYARADDAARAKLTVVESQTMSKKAKADFDVAIAKAEGRHDIATEKCGALSGVDKTACISAADASFAAEQADATARRDQTLVQAESSTV